MGNNLINIEIVYITAESQLLIAIQVNRASTVQQALEHSGILKRFPEISLNKYSVGIFHKLVRLDTQLEDGDRIEIYRPLVIDPKEKRRIKGKTERNKRHPN